MSKLVLYSWIVLCSVFLSSIAQVFLKKSAQKTYTNKVREYLNPLIVSGYAIYAASFLVTTFSLKVIPFSMMPILDSSGYVFVALLSYIFFKEKYNRRQMIGVVLVMLGIGVYSINMF